MCMEGIGCVGMDHRRLKVFKTSMVWIDMCVEGLGWVRGYLKRSERSRVGMECLGWVYRVMGR